MTDSRGARVWLALALAVIAIGLAACGGDDGSSSTATDESETSAEAILIRTHIVFTPAGGKGDILPASTLGGAAFCPGGTFRDGRGQAPLLEVVKRIRCPGGSLTITFDPRGSPSSPNVQTGPWRVVSGTGTFEGLTGEGRFKGVFQQNGNVGNESFRGTVGG